MSAAGTELPGKQPLRLDGKVVLITGAGRGLGRAYAKALAGRGASVVVNGRTAEHVHNTVAEIAQVGGIAVPVIRDVTQADAGREIIAATLAAFGRIDVLINNAGGLAKTDLFADISIAVRDHVFQHNLHSTWDVTAAAWPHMLAQGSGRIIMTTSPAIFGAPHAVHYATSKAAIIGLAKSLAAEGAECGIKVNVISPVALTPAAQALSSDPESLAFYGKHFPAELVANAMVWLVHDSCALTGEILCVTGARIVRDFLAETEGYRGSPQSFDPESIQAHLQDILSTGRFALYRDSNELFAQVGKLFG